MTQPNQSADATKPVANDEEAMPALPEPLSEAQRAGLQNEGRALCERLGHERVGEGAEAFVYGYERALKHLRADRASRGSEALLKEVEQALQLATGRVTHRLACYSVRPTEEWNQHGSVSYANCCCELKTIEAALTALRSRPKVEARLLTDAEFSRASDGHYLPPYAREAVQRAVLEKNFPGIAVKE